MFARKLPFAARSESVETSTGSELSMVPWRRTSVLLCHWVVAAIAVPQPADWRRTLSFAEREDEGGEVSDKPICSDSTGMLPGQSMASPLGYVHITKTGGTALKRQLACPDLRCENGHDMTTQDWQAAGLDTLVVLREPLERFASAFAHARNGTEIYLTTHMQRQAQAFSLPVFIDALRNETHPQAAAAWNLLLHREGGQQFREQAAWLTGDPLRTHVVCYDKDDLIDRLEFTLGRLGSNCSLRSVALLNNSTHSAQADTAEADEATREDALSEAQKLWVRTYYSHDTALWQAHCSHIAHQQRIGYFVITAEHSAVETELAVRRSWADGAWATFDVAPSEAPALLPNGSNVHVLRMESAASFGMDVKQEAKRATNGKHPRFFKAADDTKAAATDEMAKLNLFLRAKILAMMRHKCEVLERGTPLQYFMMVDDDTAVERHRLSTYLRKSMPDPTTTAIYAGLCGEGSHMKGGPGIIFSRKLLQDACPHFDRCDGALEYLANHKLKGSGVGGDGFIARCLAKQEKEGLLNYSKVCIDGFRAHPPWVQPWMLSYTAAMAQASDSHEATLEVPVTPPNDAWMAAAVSAGLRNGNTTEQSVDDDEDDSTETGDTETFLTYHRVAPSARAGGMRVHDPRCAPWVSLKAAYKAGEAKIDWPLQVSRCEPRFALVGVDGAATNALFAALRDNTVDVEPTLPDEGSGFFVQASVQLPPSSGSVSSYLDALPHVDPRDFTLLGDASDGDVWASAAASALFAAQLPALRVLLVLSEPVARLQRSWRAAYLRAPAAAAWTGGASDLDALLEAGEAVRQRCPLAAVYAAAGVAPVAPQQSGTNVSCSLPPILSSGLYHLQLPRWLALRHVRVAFSDGGEQWAAQEAAQVTPWIGAVPSATQPDEESSAVGTTAGAASHRGSRLSSRWSQIQKRLPEVARERLMALTGDSLLRSDVMLREAALPGLPKPWMSAARAATPAAAQPALGWRAHFEDALKGAVPDFRSERTAPLDTNASDWRRNAVFLRVPKTAGTTLTDVCEAVCAAANTLDPARAVPCTKLSQREEQYAELRGMKPGTCVLWDAHIDWDMVRRLQASWPAPLRAFTILREPIARALSEHKYCRAGGEGANSCWWQDQWGYVGHFDEDELKRLRALDIGSWARETRLPAHNRMVRMLAGYHGQGAVIEDNSISRHLVQFESVALLPSGSLTNGSITAANVSTALSALAGARGWAPTTDDDLRKAKATLTDGLAAFGLTEDLEGTFAALGEAFGWESDPLALATLADGHWRRSSDQEGVPLDEETRAALANANAHDVALYNFAKDLFASRSRSHAPAIDPAAAAAAAATATEVAEPGFATQANLVASAKQTGSNTCVVATAASCSAARWWEAPVVVGGVGGSGTRAVVELLDELGVSMACVNNTALFGASQRDKYDELCNDAHDFAALHRFRLDTRESKDTRDENQDVQPDTLSLARRYRAPLEPSTCADLGDDQLDAALGAVSFTGRTDDFPSWRNISRLQMLERIVGDIEPAARRPYRWGFKNPSSTYYLNILRCLFPCLLYLHATRDVGDLVQKDAFTAHDDEGTSQMESRAHEAVSFGLINQREAGHLDQFRQRWASKSPPAALTGDEEALLESYAGYIVDVNARVGAWVDGCMPGRVVPMPMDRLAVNGSFDGECLDEIASPLAAALRLERDAVVRTARSYARRSFDLLESKRSAGNATAPPALPTAVTAMRLPPSMLRPSCERRESKEVVL